MWKYASLKINVYLQYMLNGNKNFLSIHIYENVLYEGVPVGKTAFVRNHRSRQSDYFPNLLPTLSTIFRWWREGVIRECQILFLVKENSDGNAISASESLWEGNFKPAEWLFSQSPNVIDDFSIFNIYRYLKKKCLAVYWKNESFSSFFFFFI